MSDSVLVTYLVVGVACIAAMVSVILLITGRGSVSAGRSCVSIAIQAVLLIGIFAVAYSAHGLSGCEASVDVNCRVPVPWDTALYFSTVTWTTLGYGDFQPAADLLLLAAFQAVLGCGFLGLLVGIGAAAIFNRRKQNPPER